MKSVRILPTPHGSRLLGEELHTVFHLDVPVSPTDLNTLIKAAFRSPDDQPRVELSGVIADRTQSGVRLRIVANNSWFDIPWEIIARGIHLK